MPQAVFIRSIQPTDIPGILQIQAESPEASHWSARDYGRACEGAFHGIVGLTDGLLAGFLVARLAPEEMEILNLAVAPAFRRQRIATQLLVSALGHARALAAKECFLEVRRTNSAAISCYLRNGFSQVGCRSAYYSDPQADALLFKRSL